MPSNSQKPLRIRLREEMMSNQSDKEVVLGL